MINAAEIPQIPGNMEALAGHASKIKTAGTDFAETGRAVDATWQGLGARYRAPEAAQLFAATGPVRTVSASTGEDITTVGTALAAYAGEVKEIKARLAALKSQAEAFVADVRDDEDWREDEDKVNKHNGLMSAVNTAVAAFFEAQRRCANTINALYGGRQYRADNADGRIDDGEFGFTADQLNAAAGDDDALPWGSNAAYDRGFLGDVGAFFVGIGEGFMTMLGDLGALIGRDPRTGGWSWDTAGQSWKGLGTFAYAALVYSNPLTIVASHTTGLPGFEKHGAGTLLLDAGKSIIAYDTWGQDKSKAAGMATFNIVSAVAGTKGAGGALRGTGAAITAVRESTTAVRISGALIRAGNWVDNLPTVGDIAVNVVRKFDIQIPHFGPVAAIAGDIGITHRFDVEMPAAPHVPDAPHAPDTMHVDTGNGTGDHHTDHHNGDTDLGDTDLGDTDPVDHHGGDADPGNHHDGDSPAGDASTRDPADGADGGDSGSSSRPEWLLQRLEEGNEFNRRREPFYPANEVHVGARTDKGQYLRVDSYDPGREIVSRKHTQLGEVQPKTVIGYLLEFDRNYKAGTVIADTPSNRRQLGNELIGQELEGEMILEVPVQNGPVPIEILERAEDLDITIRDEAGKVYEIE